MVIDMAWRLVASRKAVRNKMAYRTMEFVVSNLAGNGYFGRDRGGLHGRFLLHQVKQQSRLRKEGGMG